MMALFVGAQGKPNFGHDARRHEAMPQMGGGPAVAGRMTARSITIKQTEAEFTQGQMGERSVVRTYSSTAPRA
jgi:hypothetical protein